MQSLKKISLINLGILFGYCIIISFFLHFRPAPPQSYRELEVMIYVMFCMIIHIVVILGLSIKNFVVQPKDKEKAKSFLLTSLIILLVGFPSCLAGAVGLKELFK